jgi:hypothetical protein
MYKKLFLTVVLISIGMNINAMNKTKLVEVKWLINNYNRPVRFYVYSPEKNLLEDKTVSPYKRKKGFTLTWSAKESDSITVYSQLEGDFVKINTWTPSGNYEEYILSVQPDFSIGRVVHWTPQELQAMENTYEEEK